MSFTSSVVNNSSLEAISLGEPRRHQTLTKHWKCQKPRKTTLGLQVNYKNKCFSAVLNCCDRNSVIVLLFPVSLRALTLKAHCAQLNNCSTPNKHTKNVFNHIPPMFLGHKKPSPVSIFSQVSSISDQVNKLRYLFVNKLSFT